MRASKNQTAYYQPRPVFRPLQAFKQLVFGFLDWLSATKEGEIISGSRQFMVNKVFMVNQLSIPWVDFDA